MSHSSSIVARRSYPGKRVLIVCAAFVAVLGGIGGWYLLSERPRTGPYLDVLALDGEYGVAVRNERTRGRAYIELFGTGEGLRWQALVPRYHVPDGAIGVAASDGAITVRFPRDGRTQIFGFATLTARKLGTVTLGLDLAREDDGHMAPGVATMSGGMQSFEVIEPDDAPTRVYAISMAQGKIDWDRDLPGRGVEGMWLTPAHVVIQQPGTVSVIERTTGTVWSRAAGQTCLAGEAIVITNPRGVELVALADQAVLASTRVATAVGPCGVHGGRVWARLDEGPEIWAPGEGSPGELIVPMRVRDGDGARLVGVDLGSGTQIWTSTASAALRDATLVPAGASLLVRLGDTLISIDARSGAARAVAVPDTRPLRAHHVAKGFVWLVSDGGLTSLDVATLEVRGTWRGGPRPQDASGPLSALGLRTSP